MTVDEFNEKEAEFLERLPIELRSAISRMAYERGHSYGYEEVLNNVIDMVDALEQPIQNLINNMR